MLWTNEKSKYDFLNEVGINFDFLSLISIQKL